MIKDVHIKNPTLLICAELVTNTRLRRWLKGATSYAPEKRPESVGHSATLTILELEQSKTAVLNTLTSQHSLRSLVPQVRVRLLDVIWAEESSGRPPEHFQLTISAGCPSKLVLLRWEKRILPSTPFRAKLRSHALVTGFTDNGARIRTLVVRGYVSLRSD